MVSISYFLTNSIILCTVKPRIFQFTVAITLSNSTMKCLILISLLISKIISITAEKSIIADLQPQEGYHADLGQWITFMAKVDDDCGVKDVNIRIHGYAVTGYKSRDSESCPSGYFCKDYTFAAVGQNWWKVEVENLCGQYTETQSQYFCAHVCPRYLRNSIKGVEMNERLEN